MDTLKAYDLSVVLWLNKWVGRYQPLDEFTELIVSDYFIPVILALTLATVLIALVARLSAALFGCG